MTNKIMSIAAAAAILGTSAYAFDTNGAGQILNRDATAGQYNSGVAASGMPANALLRSYDSATTDRLKGDALIFPAFQADTDGWETEIVLRNNHRLKAVIAKAVIYDGADSSEVRDFNIYLSGNDQVRFTLSKNGVKSTDGSIVIQEPIRNADGTPSNDPARVVFASKASPFSADLTDIANQNPVNSGYVIVYGMAETNGSNLGFDHDHAGIWSEYRNVMDMFRPQWRTYATTMEKGVYTGGLTDINISVPNVDANTSTMLVSTSSDALSGTVRMYNAKDSNGARDMVIPATALSNFTDGDNSLMLWAPSEYAAIADRCIDVAVTPYAGYNPGCVTDDTVTFLVTNATYTYENASTATAKTVTNQLVMTQPTKRFLTQMFEADGNGYWLNDDSDYCEEPAGASVISGEGYGVVASFSIYDDDEKTFGQKIGSPIDDSLTSPGDHDEIAPERVGETCREVAKVVDIEKGLIDPETGTAWPESANGFVSYNFLNGAGAIPAIVTQMTASVVSSEGKINWVYAPTNRPALAN